MDASFHFLLAHNFPAHMATKVMSGFEPERTDHTINFFPCQKKTLQNPAICIAHNKAKQVNGRKVPHYTKGDLISHVGVWYKPVLPYGISVEVCRIVKYAHYQAFSLCTHSNRFVYDKK